MNVGEALLKTRPAEVKAIYDFMMCSWMAGVRSCRRKNEKFSLERSLDWTGIENGNFSVQCQTILAIFS